MLHEYVVKLLGWPARLLTAIADENPARQGLIQSRPLPKARRFHQQSHKRRASRNCAFTFAMNQMREVAR
jgi:hypothetical protein